MGHTALLEHPRVAHHVLETTDGPFANLTAGLFVVASAPAGWYDINEDTRRWFDGRSWTDHYAPIVRLVPDIDPQPVPVRTNHGFHAIMVIMTLGAWMPVWFTIGVWNILRRLERSRDVTGRG